MKEHLANISKGGEREGPENPIDKLISEGLFTAEGSLTPEAVKSIICASDWRRDSLIKKIGLDSRIFPEDGRTYFTAGDLEVITTTNRTETGHSFIPYRSKTSLAVFHSGLPSDFCGEALRYGDFRNEVLAALELPRGGRTNDLSVDFAVLAGAAPGGVLALGEMARSPSPVVSVVAAGVLGIVMGGFAAGVGAQRFNNRKESQERQYDEALTELEKAQEE